MIKLQAIGNLGKDCVTNTVNGKSVINFNVAHTEKYRDAQGNQKDWTDKTAIAPYLRKGTQVYVDGIPEVRTYQKNDGTTAASLNLRVLSVQLLGNRGDNAAPSQSSGYSAPASATVSNNAPAHNEVSEPADDLPF